MLCTVHILYGGSEADDPERVEEIQQITQFLRKRTLDRTAWARNLIPLGDFNIFNPKDTTITALTDASFIIPQKLQTLLSNAPKSKYYDQIAFRVREDWFGTTGKAGCLISLRLYSG